MLSNIINNSDADFNLVISSGILNNISIAARNGVIDVKKEAIITIANLLFKSNDIGEMLLNFEFDLLLLETINSGLECEILMWALKAISILLEKGGEAYKITFENSGGLDVLERL